MAKIKVTGQRKLRVTGQGAPRYQSQPGTILGSIGQPNNFAAPSFPAFNQSIHSVNYPSTQCPNGQQKNPITGACEPIMDMNGQAQPNYTGGTPSISIDPGGPNIVRNPTTGKYETVDSFQKQPNIYKGQKTPKDLFNYNTMLPSAIIAGMSGIRGMAEGIQGNNIDVEYAKRLGQTDAFVGATPNKMAYGNLEINTGAQGLYTTPVNFAGRPTSEFVGYPAYQPQSSFGKEGGELDQFLNFQNRSHKTNTFVPGYSNDASLEAITPKSKGDWYTEKIEIPAPRTLDWNKVGTTAAGVGVGSGLLSAAGKNWLKEPKKKDGGLAQYQQGNSVLRGAMIPDRPMSYSDMPVVAEYFPTIGNPQIAPVSASADNMPAPYQASGPVDIDAALKAVAGAESGSRPGQTKLGMRTNLVGEGGKRASASGTYQITTDTLKQIYSRYFKDDYPSFSNFNNSVKTNAEVEYAAARALMTENVNKYGIYGIGAWYYPQYAARAASGDMSVWNKIPRQDYGNKLTWGQDFTKKYNLYKQYAKFKEGGEYELDDDEIQDILANGGQIEYL